MPAEMELLLKLGEERGYNRALRQLRLDELQEEYERSTRELIDVVKRAVAMVLGALTSMEEMWRLCCDAVVAGDAAETHSLRGKLEEILQTRGEILEEALGVIESTQRKTGENLPEEAQLLQELAGLERIRARVFARWHTQEDLEDLVAESTAPTAPQLDAVQHKYGFPQAWYDEDSKPF